MRVSKALILRAVAEAQAQLARAVEVSDVVQWVQDEHGVGLSGRAVGKEMNRLFSRGDLESPGRVGRGRAYRIPGSTVEARTVVPRWMRTLRVVEDLCAEEGRGVRMVEIRARAEEHGIPPDDAAVDVSNLRAHGHLEVADRVIGDGGGMALYVPSGWQPAEGEGPASPTTALGVVAQVFRDLWEGARAKAVRNGELIRPITTGDVRARLRSRDPQHPFLRDPQLVVNAMKQLSTRSEPVVRAIRRSESRNLLWVAADAADDEIRLRGVWATDSERAVEAVRRAEASLGGPVSMADILNEATKDPTLRPVGVRSLRNAIHDVSRATLAGSKGERVPRRRVQVQRLGRLDGKRYFSVSSTPHASVWVDLQMIWRRISSRALEKEVERAAVAALGGVASCRITRAVQALEGLRATARAIANEEGLDDWSRQRATDALKRLDEVISKAEGHLTRVMAISPAVIPEEERIGWTWRQVKRRFSPHYEPARRASSAAELLPHLVGGVRRFKNPRYVQRSHPDERLAAEYLFDPTSAMLFAARNWGGAEVRTLAAIASAELGPMREPAAIIPHLGDPGENSRRIAVACLSFLPFATARNALERTAMMDEDPTIREVALLGLALRVAKGSRGILEKCASEDPDPRTREWASRLAAADGRDIVAW